MAHREQQEYCEWVRHLYPQNFNSLSSDNINVLDVGSLDINGNNRGLFSDNVNYLGIDLQAGKNVNLVCPMHRLQECNPGGPVYFDTIISTECLEHDKYWVLSLQAMCSYLRPKGLLLITCATTGRKPHGIYEYTPEDSPFTNDYYYNLTENDFRQAIFEVDRRFKTVEFSVDHNHHDLRLYAIKK